MAAQFYPHGFSRTDSGEKADLYIINTCTVTHRADSDCRSMIRRAARQNPSGRIVVTGCYVDNDPELIAGMEGALPSVVGGIIPCPLIAVPTSVGYGTAMAGFTALFSMLTSCASGITVVNIDNGFGAAMAVHRILPPAS